MKTLLVGFFMGIQVLSAQVGIGTTAPTKTLDINGELRVRTLPTMNTSLNLLTSDANGNVGKITNAKLLKDIYFKEATGPVNYFVNTTGQFTNDNINLNLDNVVVIPARVKATLIVNYSVPMGNTFRTYQVNGYIGIRFLRNGVEAPAGSRKFSMPNTYRNGSNNFYEVVDMVTVGTTFLETIDNTANNSPLTITYALKGYIEQAYSATQVNYRFNMWASSGDNYNWGKGFISTQLYIQQ
ncbi:MAG: hypothetical protein R2797_04885 [Gelidibacter sp.]